jgi:hypothetical protein
MLGAQSSCMPGFSASVLAIVVQMSALLNRKTSSSHAYLGFRRALGAAQNLVTSSSVVIGGSRQVRDSFQQAGNSKVHTGISVGSWFEPVDKLLKLCNIDVLWGARDGSVPS